MIHGTIKNSSRYYLFSGELEIAFKYSAGHENELENLRAVIKVKI